MRTIGENIRAARKRAGLTQKALGEKCGMPDSQIRQYELGIINAKLPQITRIADGLGINISELIGADFQDYKNNMVCESDTGYSFFRVQRRVFPELEIQLLELGYKVNYSYNESDECYCDFRIETPQCEIIPVSRAELENLDSEINMYLKFRLQELLKNKR